MLRDTTRTFSATLEEEASGESPGSSPPGGTHMLLVGPLPPPMSGSHVPFEIVCDEAPRLTGGTADVIDTSQKKLKRNVRIASLGNFKQALSIVRQFRRKLAAADVVLVFGSNGFLLSMAPILLLMARRAGKPMYLRAFGGSLDCFAQRRNPLLRRLLFWTMRNASGFSCETELIQTHFEKLLGITVHRAPNFRRLPDADQIISNCGTRDILQLVFIGIVREEKGIFVLLESLRKLQQQGVRVQCDIFGPFWPKHEERFKAELEWTPGAVYRGVLDPEDVVSTICQYDAMAMPTIAQGEGHPGVIVEAMMAGIPVLTTAFRSIPELVQHEVNGLIVPPEDADAFADAIRRIHQDRGLLKDMAQRNWQRRRLYDVNRVVPEILRQMGVEVSHAQSPQIIRLPLRGQIVAPKL